MHGKLLKWVFLYTLAQARETTRAKTSPWAATMMARLPLRLPPIGKEVRVSQSVSQCNILNLLFRSCLEGKVRNLFVHDNHITAALMYWRSNNNNNNNNNNIIIIIFINN